VFQHLGKTRQAIRLVQRGKERSVEHHSLGLVEGTDLVFQSVEVDTRFAPNGSIDSAQDGGGQVDDIHATLESGGRKTAQV